MSFQNFVRLDRKLTIDFTSHVGLDSCDKVALTNYFHSIKDALRAG